MNDYDIIMLMCAAFALWHLIWSLVLNKYPMTLEQDKKYNEVCDFNVAIIFILSLTGLILIYF